MRTLLLPAVATAVLATGLVRTLWSERLARLVLDVPNDRSLHEQPVPRTGGIGLMLAALAGWWISGVLAAAGPVRATAVVAALLAAVFLADDVRSLPVGMRFAAQLAAAAGFVWATAPHAAWLVPLLLIGLAWSMNLYNFMDGSNGFAGGMALIGFAALAAGAEAGGAPDIAALAAVVAAASLGFLVWNFDPARIFLGDAGSVPLGFLAAAIGVLGWQREAWPFWFPALVFATFIADSGLTLAKRLIHRENPLAAHRSHYYQRLIRMGDGHRLTALRAYALMAATAVSALAFRTASPLSAALLIAAWLAAFLLIALAIDRRWRASPVRGS
jgi:UDP-N-acetylmuramyl pentapeptide phosphotransferase/UDP-N-acetylglucosamine-1-phosphate transferase